MAAGLGLGELQEEAGHLHHAGVLVQHHQAPGAHHRPRPGKGLVVHRKVQELLGKTPSGGPSDLHRFQCLPLRGPAADLHHYLPQGGAHGHLHQPGVPHLPSEGEDLGPGGALGPQGAEPLRPLSDDEGDVGPGLHVVDVGGLAPQALLGGEGRPGPGLPPSSFDGGQKRRLLPTHECPRPLEHPQGKGKAAPQDVLPQKAQLLGLGDGGPEVSHRQWVLGPHVHVAL